MKALAFDNPNLVRVITLPNKTWLGKDVLGVGCLAEAAPQGMSSIAWREA